MPPLPVTRAEISRSRLVGNFSRLRSMAQRVAPGCDVVAVVKADAYGHSVALCAPWLVEAGAQWLGVTSVAEGVGVRRLCPEVHILVMSGLPPGDAASLLDARLTPTVWTVEHLESLMAVQRDSPPGSIPVHLELDTGMSRQGVAPADLEPMFARLRATPALRLEGVFTHFASPEMLNAEQNSQQMVGFQSAIEQIATAGFRPQWIHAGNSSTLLAERETQALAAMAQEVGAALLLRPGIALYGYVLPFQPQTKLPIPLQQVMVWKTSIASLRRVQAGTKIGYGGSYIAPATMRLALLPVGYADGLNRKLSNRGHVLIHGKPAPIVGRVSMDLTIVDVSAMPDAAVGDEVVLLGEQKGQRITADDHADWAETISYEILCAIGARVPRIPSE